MALINKAFKRSKMTIVPSFKRARAALLTILVFVKPAWCSRLCRFPRSPNLSSLGMFALTCFVEFHVEFRNYLIWPDRIFTGGTAGSRMAIQTPIPIEFIYLFIETR